MNPLKAAADSLRENRQRIERIRCRVASMRDQDATRLALHLDVHAERGIPLEVENEVARLMRDLRV